MSNLHIPFFTKQLNIAIKDFLFESVENLDTHCYDIINKITGFKQEGILYKHHMKCMKISCNDCIMCARNKFARFNHYSKYDSDFINTVNIRENYCD